jgi:hypothetical protein
MSVRKTNQEFIKDANTKHGDLYDYSKVEYVNAHTKIKIICPIHGEFEQRPHRHLQGDGCKECGKQKIREKNASDLSSFIEKAKTVHGDKYDYSLVNYKNNKTNVTIICPIHGIFEQLPTSHLTMKSGCSKCSREKVKLKNVKSKDDFIKQSKIIHGDKYDYSNVNYINTNEYVNITCPKHGSFFQKPYKHLQNQGCPVCKESKLEKEIRKLLINNNIKFIQHYGKKNGGNWLDKQVLDFFLVDYKVAIECQGEQHFKPVDFGNKGKNFAHKAFKENIKRDEEKYEKCKKENVKIFYYTDVINNINGGYFDIVYTDKIEMINNILKNEK